MPAFAGLAAPHWDQYARGTIVGLTGGVTKEQLVRATLESVAYQVTDNLDVMNMDSGIPIKVMRVDGGMVTNNFLMQFQSDIMGIPVDVPVITETTALGATYLAGLAVGYWRDRDEIAQLWQVDQSFHRTRSVEDLTREAAQWQRAIRASLVWANE